MMYKIINYYKLFRFEDRRENSTDHFSENLLAFCFVYPHGDVATNTWWVWACSLAQLGLHLISNMCSGIHYILPCYISGLIIKYCMLSERVIVILSLCDGWKILKECYEIMCENST